MATVVWGDSYSTVGTAEQGLFSSSATKSIKMYKTRAISEISIKVWPCPCNGSFQVKSCLCTSIYMYLYMCVYIILYKHTDIYMFIYMKAYMATHRLKGILVVCMPPEHHGSPNLCHKWCPKSCHSKFPLSPLSCLSHLSDVFGHLYSLLKLENTKYSIVWLNVNCTFLCIALFPGSSLAFFHIVFCVICGT